MFTHHLNMKLCDRVVVSPGSLESEIIAMAASLSTLAQDNRSCPAVMLAKAELQITTN